MENEIYRYVVINNCVNMKYKISNFGRVINVEKNNRIVKQTKTIGGYLICGIDGKVYNVHRLVLMAFIGVDEDPAKTICDHKNNNGFDNRLSNLHWVDYKQNGMNKNFREGKTYKGVYYNQKYNTYTAKIQYNGKMHHLGSRYNTLHDALEAYNNKAVELFGREYAKLNDV